MKYSIPADEIQHVIGNHPARLRGIINPCIKHPNGFCSVVTEKILNELTRLEEDLRTLYRKYGGG